VVRESDGPEEDSPSEESDSEAGAEDRTVVYEPEGKEEPEKEEVGEGRPGTPRRPFSITRFLMIFFGFMALYAFINPDVGLAFASVADLFLSPLIGFGGAFPTVTILLAGVLTTTISSIIRDHYTNWVKQARTQTIVRAWSRERFEAMRKGQQTRLAKLVDAQKVFQKDQLEMMTTPYKSMAWTFFLFIVLFTWLRLFVDVTLHNSGNQWIAVPWSPHVPLNGMQLGFPLFTHWILLYSLLALPFGLILTRVLKYIRFRRRLERMGIPPTPLGAGGTDQEVSNDPRDRRPPG
jgi:uncharacterized membrane protein (DUF106 family)